MKDARSLKAPPLNEPQSTMTTIRRFVDLAVRGLVPYVRPAEAAVLL